MNADMQLIPKVVNQLQDLVEDTYMQVGSEAYSVALTVYNYAKNSPSGTALEGVGRGFRSSCCSQTAPNGTKNER
jgi:hypothetical protein